MGLSWLGFLKMFKESNEPSFLKEMDQRDHVTKFL